MANLPGFGNEPTIQAQYASLVDRTLQYCGMALDGLTQEQVNDTRDGLTNSLGFDVWHVVRTIDNIIHFVFERETPVWLRDSFHDSGACQRWTRARAWTPPMPTVSCSRRQANSSAT